MKKETNTTTKGELLQDEYELRFSQRGGYYFIDENINGEGHTILILNDDENNANEALKILNERQKLLDSNRELLETLKELHGYTASRVKKYDIKDSTYFHVINMMANGLHTKITK